MVDDISPPFPRHTAASLRTVGMTSRTPLLQDNEAPKLSLERSSQGVCVCVCQTPFQGALTYSTLFRFRKRKQRKKGGGKGEEGGLMLDGFQ